MTARLGVATLDKGMAIACEPRLDPNRHRGSECRLIRVRASKGTNKYHAEIIAQNPAQPVFYT